MKTRIELLEKAILCLRDAKTARGPDFLGFGIGVEEIIQDIEKLKKRLT